MFIDIQAQHFSLSPSTKEKIRSKLESTFRRFDNHVNSVIFRVSDNNGPKGGIDTSCCLTVKLDKTKDIVITGNYENVFQCLERSCERAKKNISKQLDKYHHSGRRFVSHTTSHRSPQASLYQQ